MMGTGLYQSLPLVITSVMTAPPPHYEHSQCLNDMDIDLHSVPLEILHSTCGLYSTPQKFLQNIYGSESYKNHIVIQRITIKKSVNYKM